MTVTTGTPILEARGLRRSFGAVRALDGADFDVCAGEVVALIGDNGAGKSTMVSASSGNPATLRPSEPGRRRSSTALARTAPQLRRSRARHVRSRRSAIAITRASS